MKLKLKFKNCMLTSKSGNLSVITILLLLVIVNSNAATSIIKNSSVYINYAGSLTFESFETASTITGSDVVNAIPITELDNHFEISANRNMQLWGAGNHATDGDQILFFHSSTTTANNPAEITFSNFNGTNAEINTFGFFLVDWANANTVGKLSFSTNTGDSGIIDIADSWSPDWEKRFYGIINSTPFSEITISTTTSGDWLLFDRISYGISGLLAPNATNALEDNISYSDICEGTSLGFPYNIDGVNNGITSDPNETFIVISVINGTVGGHSGGTGKQLYLSYSNSGCTNPSCGNNCQSGKFVFRFVDMTVPGFTNNNPDTWVYKTISGMSFTAWNDHGPRANASTIPYSQAKAYKVANNASPSNLIDINPSIDITGSSSTDVYFEDLDDGIGEVYIQTDFAENILDEIVLYSKPANTALGTDVEVQVGNVTLTFEDVNGVGITEIVEHESAPPLSGNFSVCDPPVYYNINTTAEYNGDINICIEYEEACEGAGLSLVHYENSTWIDVTTTVDTINNIICGTVSSLSPFVIAKKQTFINYWIPLIILLIILFIYGFLKKKKKYRKP